MKPFHVSVLFDRTLSESVRAGALLLAAMALLVPPSPARSEEPAEATTSKTAPGSAAEGPSKARARTKARALISLDLLRMEVGQLQEALERMAQQQQKVAAAQKTIRTLMAEKHLQPESYSEVARTLAIELVNVQVELHGRRGRIRAIERAVDELAKKVAAKAKKDEVLGKLREIVDIRHRNIAGLMARVKNATASQTELGEARAESAEAMIRLVKRQDELAGKDGQGTLATLNEQLLQATIDTAELEAREQFVLSRLSDMQELAGVNKQYESKEFESRMLDQNLQKLKDESRDLERQQSRLQLERALIGQFGLD